jgi:hypothetical protein
MTNDETTPDAERRLPTGEEARYHRWLQAGSQAEPQLEVERQVFLREFSVSAGCEILAEMEPWTGPGKEPGLGAQQRWFRLMRLRMEATGQLPKS